MDIQSSTLDELFVLYPVIIPGWVTPVKPAGLADGGIPKSLYDDQPQGLRCLIDPWTELKRHSWTMAADDRADLYVNDDPTPVAGKTVESGQEQDRITLHIPNGHLIHGINRLHYKVTRPSENAVPSRDLFVLYHLRAPGDPAPDGLDLVIPPDVVRDGVSAERAAQGVEFGFAYTYPRNYDRINFLLGDVTVPFEVADASTPVVKTLFTDTFQQVGDNANTLIEYRVTDQLGNANQSPIKRLDIHLGRPLELLPPTIDQALGNQLDPADTPNGATVRIPAEVNLLEGDSGEVRWVGLPGAGSINVPFTISASEEGQSKTVPVPKSVVEANVDQTITLDYTLRRQGGLPLPSEPAAYDIRRQVGSGRLLVMGARGTSNALHWTTVASSRLLTALNAVTQQPLEALWQYEGDSGDPIRSAVFHDKQPWRLLHVRTSEDEVRVNPANLFGCGNFKIHDPSQAWGAFIARRNQGNLIGWGVPGHGGAVPSTIATLTDIVGVAHAAYAFAAWRANGRVVAWGWEERGGVVPAAISNLTDIVEVVGTGHAFAARRATGHLVAWGDAIAGGVIPAEIALLDDFEEVAASAHAFAARRANGTVVAWGRPDLGGAVPGDIASLNDIVELSNAYYVFAARRANGSVVAWGTEPNAGGTVPAAIATLTDIVEVVGASTALAARRSNGSVVAWGNANSGGAIPAPIATLNDIIQVVSTSGSFAALRASGHVVTWGSSDYGAPVPATIGVFDDIVQIAATAAAFAALRRNGTVVAWGNEMWGGAVNVNDLTNVRALYANSQAFVALTSDGRVVTWGLADAGGNSDSVQGQLRGQISYYATPASRGAALKRQARSEGP
ncbi:hypothetical protein [Pseudomonas sp. NFACC04-2]|jgi:alpha-tubulin suppressor-like RCC1 family protein|uniref:RCC1 domain-containing protein n=1 Tax=Pseudomonas sp. NFACC04-2 TaxID=1566242 RepID=UPI000908FE9F|nr:hypothetical protein [Pseudomonas sp. NFACC04-2]SFW84125.1 hypothetical protein SAMN03159439_05629 [Pseudomonas sp. NFACC04-2]